MKKILILMLLTLTTVFTQINAQGPYLDFDGNNDYVDVSYTIAQVTNEYKINIKASFDTLVGDQILLRHNNESVGVLLWIRDGSLQWWVRDSISDSWQEISVNVNTNQIYDIEAYINDSTDQYYLKVDGVTTNGNFSGKSIEHPVFSSQTYVGEQLDGGRAFNGQIYDLSIETDINGLYDYDFNASFNQSTLDDTNQNTSANIVGATWQGSPAVTYPVDINLTSNYGDYFDADIQFQDQDELYIDYPISAQSADVNDDWQATAPTSNIGSFTFQDWYDLDNNTVFSTNPSLSITGPDRDYNLQARYTGVTEYDIDLNMESGISGNIQYQGNTFNNNSVTQLASVIDQTVPDGTAWQATAPNVAGFTFDHWYDLDSNSIYSTNTFIDITNTTSDVNLEARYTAVPSYTFTFDTNLPDPDEFEYRPPSSNVDLAAVPPVTETVNQGDNFTVKAQTENLGLYTFDGWYDLDNNQFYSTQTDITITNIQRDWNIEARYSLPDQYDIDLILSSQIGNIQFQIDDETPIFAPSISETVFAGQDFQATAPDDPTNYEFQHWYDLNNNVVFSNNLFITAQDIDRDYNLEARYLEIFDITFDTQGGNPINADTAVDGESYALPTPTREGFIFLGWNDSNDPLPRPIIESPYTITEDVTFIANWVEIIEVTFNSNGGTAVPSQNVSAGGVITPPAIPSKFGYLFDGWYTDNITFANEYDFDSSVNSAFTLHAKWILGSDSDVGETLNTWISDSGISSIFIVLVIMVATSVTLGLINAQMFVIVISNLSILFIFGALGYIPLWILLVSGLAVVGFIVMTLFGGSRNA